MGSPATVHPTQQHYLLKQVVASRLRLPIPSPQNSRKCKNLLAEIFERTTGGLGIGPKFSASKADVLPLDDPPILCQTFCYRHRPSIDATAQICALPDYYS